MNKIIRFACALAVVVGVAGCLDESYDESATEQDLFLDTNTTPPPPCSTTCGATTPDTVVCRDDEVGDVITCAERKAREGRNPQTGKTIQIKASTVR